MHFGHSAGQFSQILFKSFPNYKTGHSTTQVAPLKNLGVVQDKHSVDVGLDL